MSQFERLELMIGSEKVEKLARARVIIFGIGGVGSYVAEALARSGIGALDIVDDDKIVLSNLNRQLYALHSTLGMDKVDVAEERIHDINPSCLVTKHKTFFTPETSSHFDFSKYDYIVDCIDTVSGKLEIVRLAKEAGKAVISSMGTGNKLDPSKFQIADISKTSVCPLARVMRSELKKRGIKNVKCIFSTENPLQPVKKLFNESGKKQVPASNAFVPSVAGLMIAGQVIRDLISDKF